jgi:Spy/CpxP family protein refolding chaperone
MKENIKTILVIASVALNAVFAATYLTYKLPLLAGAHQPSAPREPLFLQLDLTTDQLAWFKAERDKFHAGLQDLGQEIKARQMDLIDLLGESPPDQQGIERKQEEVRRLQADVQDRVIVHFLDASAILTPGQRAGFFQLIKARIEAGAPACPPWMKSLEQGQTGAIGNE